MCTDSADRPAHSPPDPKGPGEIVVTEAMVQAGVSALWDSMGYSLTGDPAEGVKSVFEAMMRRAMFDAVMSTSSPVER